jgi:hypothetical protein
VDDALASNHVARLAEHRTRGATHHANVVAPADSSSSSILSISSYGRSWWHAELLC